MMGLVAGRRRTISNANAQADISPRPRRGGNRSSGDAQPSESPADDDSEVVEPDQGNVLSHIIAQLRPGADLSRVTLPTFILEPRSMLERITNFMCHPEMLLPIPHIDDPVERFVSVVKFYLSGWHIRPPGVKKPLNPILGEVFTCYWEFDDDTRAYYIAEQTCHHPPKSSYFYMAPSHHIRVDGTLKPKSKFLGNSAASLMEGTAVLTILNRGKNPALGERYTLTQPNMYARGILFGKMKYELGDHSFVRCSETGLVADIEFKTKGWVSGTYNAVGGQIKNERTGEVLYELSGLWSEEMYIKNVKTGERAIFFDGARAKPTPPICRPIEEQDERESRRLWAKTAQAVKDRNHELATDEKTKIEDRQREEAATRGQDGVEWNPKLFRRVKGGAGSLEEGEEDLEWIINACVDGPTPERRTEQILAIHPIVEGQKVRNRNSIPPRTPVSKAPAPASQPSLAKPPAATAAAAAADTGDLIDLGTDADNEKHDAAHRKAEEKGEARSAIDSGHRSTAEIQDLLMATGVPRADKETPLVDFHGDMKGSLPPLGGGVQRTDTQGSQDSFVSAKE